MKKNLGGQTVIEAFIKTVSQGAGVYRMLGVEGKVLYIGKAKNLKKRLSNYTQTERLSNRIRKMVFETKKLVVVETTSEREALLLEISLIKSLKPKYNVIFKDDTSYPYILITDEDAPRIMHHRGAKKVKGTYFGPYPDAGAVYQIIDQLKRSFLLRTCAASVFKNRSRPCLKYHIKRCSAPCVAKINAADYATLVKQGRAFLQGQGQQVQKEVETKMLAASEAMQFEDAAVARDRLRAITHILGNQSTFAQTVKNADVLATYLEAGKAAVQLFAYRNGQHIGNSMHYPTGEADDAGEVLRLFLAMHYADGNVPPLVLTSHKVEDTATLQEALSTKITTPQRGEKLKIVQQAMHNAKSNLQRKLGQSRSWQEQMQSFQKILGSETPINRIEAFDISNISGKHPVASLVVAGSEGMLKSDYRKFAIKSKNTPDDYTMMKETLMRRYGGLLKGSKEAQQQHTEAPTWPDVVMVDGGKGHLKILTTVFEELGLSEAESGPTLCAISKGAERNKGLESIWLQGYKEALDIPHHTPLLFMLQCIRDESHRFAIGFHRQKRGKTTQKSALDTIGGIGAKRKKALLLAFGSVTAIKAASVEDIAGIEGISKALAEKIKDSL